ncbi:MAG: ABC transporter ATP-binding protein [Geminicoccaceae bacterium]
MAELRLSGLRKTFKDTVAVDALDLDVKDGEFVVLLGPTGAGKTTTLRLAAGLEKPEAGQVYIAGQDVTAVPPAGRDVAFVFQQFSLYPHYTVFDNLAFPLRSPLRRESEARIAARVREIATLLRIDSKLQNKATRLSGGEMQRVAIGRALVRKPRLFLMDEPLSSLDAKLREDLRVELKRIQRELGATILYVTHDQVEAMTMADRIGVIEHGRLLQLAAPREIYTRPANVEVARRLGSPPINLLPATALPLPKPANAATVGVRPEDVALGAEGIDARIEQVEPLGAETVVLVDAAGTKLHVLLSGLARLEAGAATRISVPPQALLYFAADGQLLAA